MRRHEAVIEVDKGSFSIVLITDLHRFVAVFISPISMANTVVFFGDLSGLVLTGNASLKVSELRDK